MPPFPVSTIKVETERSREQPTLMHPNDDECMREGRKGGVGSNQSCRKSVETSSLFNVTIQCNLSRVQNLELALRFKVVFNPPLSLPRSCGWPSSTTAYRGHGVFSVDIVPNMHIFQAVLYFVKTYFQVRGGAQQHGGSQAFDAKSKDRDACKVCVHSADCIPSPPMIFPHGSSNMPRSLTWAEP